MKEYDWSAILTRERIEKFKAIAQKRIDEITVVLENIYDSHNINAVLRSCEGFGIQTVHIIMPPGYSFKYNPSITKKSHKWIDVFFYNKVSKCVEKLREQSFSIFSSFKSKRSIPHYEIDITKGKVAIVFGNEKEGISKEMIKYSDRLFWIPMYGFSNSLNVSVAAAITISRLREKNMNNLLAEERTRELVEKWTLKDTEKFREKGGIK